MKIAHLISTYLPAVGGAQICVHNIAERHAQSSHEAVVVLPRKFAQEKTGHYRKIALWPGTMLLLTRSFPLGQIYLLKQIDRIQKKEKFHLWQVTIGYPVGVAVVDYFKQNSIPCVLRCSGEDIQIKEDVGYGVRRDKKIDARIRENYQKFDKLVAISEAMAKDYRELGVDPAKIVKIYNGINFQAALSIEERQRKRAQVRESLRAPLDKKLILTVGRNHPKKGFDLIPEIVAQLLKKRQDFQWWIVGEGTHAIKELAQKKGPEVSQCIVCKDPIGLNSEQYVYPSQELMDILGAWDVKAFPTLIETFGIVVIEAMAAGLPVATTYAPGVDELVEDGVTGLKSPVGDTQKMAENIHRLLEDVDLREKIRKNALKASQDYGWNRISEQYLRVYKEVIAGPQAARKS